MIVRISRGRIRRGHEAEAFGLLRERSWPAGTTPGLVAFVIARRMIEGQLELVAMTTWHDLESMIAVMGQEWQTPSWLPRSSPGQSSVEHLETIAESFRGLAGDRPGDHGPAGAHRDRLTRRCKGAGDRAWAEGTGERRTMAWTNSAPGTDMPAKKRELLETGTDKRYARRDERGRFTKDQVDVGRELRRRSATTLVRSTSKPGQGDKGDRKK